MHVPYAWFVLLEVLMACSGARAEPPADLAREYQQRSNEALDLKEDFEIALTALALATFLEPTAVRIYNVGFLQQKTARLQDAADSYTRAMAMYSDKDPAKVAAMRGRITQRLGELRLATGGGVIQLEVQARRTFELGRMAFDRRDSATALERFEQAYLLLPLPKLAYNVGLALEALEQFDVAAAAYDRCIALLAHDNSPEAVLLKKTTRLHSDGLNARQSTASIGIHSSILGARMRTLVHDQIPSQLAVTPLLQGSLDEGDEQSFMVQLPAKRCYTFLGARGAGITQLDVRVVSLDGTLSASSSDEKLPDPRLTICTRDSGTFMVFGKSARGAGQFAIQGFAP